MFLWQPPELEGFFPYNVDSFVCFISNMRLLLLESRITCHVTGHEVFSNLEGVFFFGCLCLDDLCLQKEMDEARNVMRELKEERDGIRGQLNAMQVSLPCIHATDSPPLVGLSNVSNTGWVIIPPRASCLF